MKIITNYKNLLIISLSIYIVILGFQITSKQSEIDKNKNFRNQQDILLLGEDGVPGFSCGLLSTEKAQQLLDSKRLRSSYVQGPTDKIGVNNRQTDTLYWSDSCRYIDEFDSSKYVELYIDTFQTQSEAEKYFKDFIPAVNDEKTLSSDKLGKKLVYDSGVYFLLRDKQIIQIATGFSEEISQKLFSDIMSSF